MILQPAHCHFCGHAVQLIHVHGHYQCPVCGTNAMPCCDADNCETDHLMMQAAPSKKGDMEHSKDQAFAQ